MVQPLPNTQATPQTAQNQGVTQEQVESFRGAHKQLNASLSSQAIKKVLDHRGSTHGDFAHGAVISQRLKLALAGGVNWETMDVVQREALEAVMGKLARIVTGDPNFIDHYRDIIGYTQLALDYTAKQPQATDVAVTRFKPNEPLTGSKIGGTL